MGALRHSINEAWDIEQRPPLLQRKALDVALILGGTAILALSVSLTATHRLANVVDDEGDGGWLLAALLDVAGDVLPLVFVALGLLFLYRVLPMHKEPLRDIWPGALVAALGLAVVKLGLELYFEEFADLGAIYGSLGAAMALLIFVYAAANVIVFGAEFASEWARADDTTRAPRAARQQLAQLSSASSCSRSGPGGAHRLVLPRRARGSARPSRAARAPRRASPGRRASRRRARKTSGSLGMAAGSAAAIAAAGPRRAAALAAAQRLDLAQARAVHLDRVAVPRREVRLGDVASQASANCSGSSMPSRARSRRCWACIIPSVMPRPVDGLMQAHASASSATPVTAGRPSTTSRR